MDILNNKMDKLKKYMIMKEKFIVYKFQNTYLWLDKIIKMYGLVIVVMMIKLMSWQIMVGYQLMNYN